MARWTVGGVCFSMFSGDLQYQPPSFSWNCQQIFEEITIFVSSWEPNFDERGDLRQVQPPTER